MQVLVVKDGHVIFHEAYGHHTYELKRPGQIRQLRLLHVNDQSNEMFLTIIM